MLTGVVVLLLVAAPSNSTAQSIEDIARERFESVMPGVDSFALPTGTPPVVRAFRVDSAGRDSLVGFVLLSSDFPPEQMGYSGPIVTLIGMDVVGRITGVQIVDYWESHRSSLGDFLRAPGVQEQFANKNVNDAFRVGGDIDGMARATISVRALARGVRDASRRVAETYFVSADRSAIVPDVATLAWIDLRRFGIVERMVVSDGSGIAEIFLAYVESDVFGEQLVGEDALGMVNRALSMRGQSHGAIVFAVNGSSLRFLNREGWTVVQGADTVAVPGRDVVPFGLASGGMLDREVGSASVMIVDSVINMTRPFEVLYRLSEDTELVAVEYTTQAARQPRPQLPVGASEVPDVVAVAPDDVIDSVDDASPQPMSDTSELTPSTVPPPVESTAVADVIDPIIGVNGADSMSDSSTPENRWSHSVDAGVRNWIGTLPIVGLLTLVLITFFTKNNLLGTLTLAVTFIFLGFIDGGFLSMSHITSVIWVGSSSIAGDLSLTLLIVFTLVSTILVGRVFCGFLCPFGALQDFLTRLVPRRVQRTVPAKLHKGAFYLKYAILVGIVLSAMFAGRVSVYQYFEPFGTVFYGSPSVLLWSIALGFILASAIIPRFYCRYVCPLGAGLAILSFISLKRIRRVEQCVHCKVCEQQCPTGAIVGPVIDFKECVRCNICEIKLKEQAGVCRHSMDHVRQRLVQIQRTRP